MRSLLLLLGVLSSRVDALWYGGGLSILAYNDLENKPAAGSAAILVQQAAPYVASSTSCILLGETLWNGTSLSFTSGGLNHTLAWQIYQGFLPSTQRLWIGRAAGDTSCPAIDSQGAIGSVDCATLLPALCTQSAPTSATGRDDNAAAWRVDQPAASVDGDGVTGARSNLRTYTGYRDHFVFKFRGVRYAPQPVRFEHSTALEPAAAPPPQKQQDAIPAVTAGADCLQPVGEVRSGSGEDCLFLNIWTPYLPSNSSADKTLRPVMFYIFGGGFKTGSGKNPNTDGTNLASRADAVVVSVNYRVGTLGFLALADGKHNGNYGLGDIVNALGWVRRNIASFGGDPSRVTIFGESAGAIAVRALLASPPAKGLFSRAISQSGPAGWTTTGILGRYDEIGAAVQGITADVLKQSGCTADGKLADQLTCLRAMNATTLTNLDASATGLVVDGTFLVTPSLIVNSSAAANGYGKGVHFVSGTNRDELAIDLPFPKNGSDIAKLAKGFADRFGGSRVKFLSSPTFGLPLPANISSPDALNETVFSTGDLAALYNTTVRASTLALYTCLEHATAYSAALNKPFASYRTFLFNRTYSPSGYTQPHCDTTDPENKEFYKCHAGEQLIVFGNLARANQADRDGHDAGFSRMVVDLWGGVGRYGDPNVKEEELIVRGYAETAERLRKAGVWTEIQAARPMLRTLQWDGGMRDFPEGKACDELALGLNYWEKAL